ncbi:MAG: hypothetical protein JNK29_02860 [Anaerolineales bacterium]|nr:hypothetical protein [Anaerolineales bacterium]
MSPGTPSWLVGVYRRLLRLYPARFRAEYAAEMEGVWAEAVAEAAARGGWALLQLAGRELRDLPAAALREQWRERTGREGLMTSLLGNELAAATDDGRPGTVRDALWAALPHALVAGLFPALLAAGLENNLAGVILALIGGAAALGALARAWRAGWPRWSASWAFYWLALVVVGVGLGGQALGVLRSQNLLEAALLGLLAVALPAGLYVIAGRDRISGLLLGLPVLMTLWVPTLEFVPGAVRDILQPVMWLAMALAAFAIVRRGSVRFGYLATLGLHLGLGLAIAYSRAYLRVYPPDAPADVRASVPTFADFLYWFIPPLVALSTLLVGPVLARVLWQLGRLAGGLGAWASRLTILGLLLALAGNFGGFGDYLGWLGAAWSWRDWFFSACAYGGLLLVGVGAALFLATPLGRSRPDRRIIAALAGVLLGLPFAATLPLWIGFRLRPGDVPFGFLQVHLHPLPAYGAALAWAVAAGALAFYLSRRPAAGPLTPAGAGGK